MPKSTLQFFKGNSRNEIPNVIPINEGKILMLRFNEVTQDYTDNYTCKVKNIFGEHSVVLQLIVQDRPSKPQYLKVVSTGSTFVVIEWKPPSFDGNDVITNYNVKYAVDIANHNFTERIVTVLTATLTNLIPAVKYYIEVYANNNIFASGNPAATLLTITGRSAPPPYTGLLPSPYDIQEQSFQVQLIKFDESFGAIREYIICVIPLSAEDQTKKEPSSYSNADITANKDGIYVAVQKLGAPATNEDAFIGYTSSKRKRRSLSFNTIIKALEADTFYAIFVRVYVEDNIFQSTPWYDVIKTKEASGIKSWIWIVVILSVILVSFVVAFVVTLCVCCRMKSKSVKSKKSQSPLYNDLNYIQTYNYADLSKRDQIYVNQTTNIEEVQSDRNRHDTNTMYEDVMNYEVPPSIYEFPQSNYEVAPESIA